MALVPGFFNDRLVSIFDPFSSGDPFKDFPLPSSSLISRENSAFVNTRIDWKETPEAHVFKADLPGLNITIPKEEVKKPDVKAIEISG